MNLGKVGVIFNGGGFTGAFSAGYMKALWEFGIRPDHLQGISVGALNAAKILEAENAKNLEKIWLEIERARASAIFNWKDIPQNLWKRAPALFSAKGLWDIIQELDMEKIVNSPTELQIVTYNETVGEKEVFFTTDKRFKENPNLFKSIILASASIPGILPRIKIGENYYSDGIYFSLESMIQTGCDTIFLFLNDQHHMEKNQRWDERLFNMKNFLYEEVVASRLKEVLREHSDFDIENSEPEEESGLIHPALRKIKDFRQQLRSVASALVNGDDLNFVQHRIIILNTRTPISTLHATGFEVGDIKAAIEQGYDQASVLMKRLEKS